MHTKFSYGALAAAAAALAIAGCGGSSQTTSTGSGAQSKPAAAQASPGVTHAEQVVSQYSNPLTSYTLPSTPVKGVSALSGKKVMFIPLVDAIPAFQVTRAGLTAALKSAGISVTDCNGQANPSGVQSCVNQAESGGYAGIITDAIPYEMAATAFQSAEAHKIPVLITDQIAEPNNEKPDLLAYQPGNINQPQLIADWIIADSKGKANVIVAGEKDSPSSQEYVTNYMEPEFKKYCSGCTVKIDWTPSQGVTPQWVETAIQKDPGAQYYYSEFEDDLSPTTQGVSLSGQNLKVEYASATTGGLTYMKQGKQVYAEIGDDVVFEGWADADDILRMITKQPTVTETIPERIFTRQNIGSISLTNAAQNSGVWYGNSSYQSGYEKLWGTK